MILFPERDRRKYKTRHKMQKKHIDQIYELYDDFTMFMLVEEVRGIASLKEYLKDLNKLKE